MESVFSQNYEIVPLHLDCHGRVKPSVLLYFAQEAAAEHCVTLGADRETLSRKNLFWAVLRHRMQILRSPAAGERIRVETWPMPTTRSAYPRSTVGYDEKGNVLFRCISLWCLMDTRTRAMVLPGKSGVSVCGILRGTELEAPHSILPKPLSHTSLRTVGYTELDQNGHMNNTRYLDWLTDLLPSHIHKEKPLREFTVCYLSEATEGQTLSLHWERLDESTLQVESLRENPQNPQKQDRVFSARLLF